MIKTKIIETTEKYDKDGNLVEKVTREKTSEDSTAYIPQSPCIQPNYGWWNNQPTCDIGEPSTHNVDMGKLMKSTMK